MRSPYNHFNCSRGCSRAPLTLADRELITGRCLTQLDEETGISFCVDCLADLPRDSYEALFHVCGETPAGQPEPAAATAEPVEHRTRTTPPHGYQQHADGTRFFDKRGRPMHDKGSFAICTCGWVAAGATREEARSRARAHREEQAALVTAGKAT